MGELEEDGNKCNLLKASEETSCLGGNSVAFNAFPKASPVLREGNIWSLQEALRFECCAVPQVCIAMFSLLLKLLQPIKEPGVTRLGQWPCTVPLSPTNNTGA